MIQIKHKKLLCHFDLDPIQLRSFIGISDYLGHTYTIYYTLKLMRLEPDPLPDLIQTNQKMTTTNTTFKLDLNKVALLKGAEPRTGVFIGYFIVNEALTPEEQQTLDNLKKYNDLSKIKEKATDPLPRAEKENFLKWSSTCQRQSLRNSWTSTANANFCSTLFSVPTANPWRS